MHRLIEANAPALLQVKGCGTVNAAELAIAAGDNPERIPSEASFASICGVSPFPPPAERPTGTGSTAAGTGRPIKLST